MTQTAQKPSYDSHNVFAKILRGEIPCEKIYNTNHSLAFKDINPLKKIHILVIPKGSYIDYVDFIEQASIEEKIDFQNTINDVIKTFALDKSGFRLITNSGHHSNQEVPHYHVHILGGETIGPMVSS